MIVAITVPLAIVTVAALICLTCYITKIREVEEKTKQEHDRQMSIRLQAENVPASQANDKLRIEVQKMEVELRADMWNSLSKKEKEKLAAKEYVDHHVVR